jgi:hypothetical protein
MRDKGPERIGEILPRILAESGLLPENRQREIEKVWNTVAGPQTAGHTRVISFRSGRLTVGVDSAPLRQELEVFRREELLKALREVMKGVCVEEIRFRLL